MALPSGRIVIEGEGAGKYSTTVNVPDGDDIAKGALLDAEVAGAGAASEIAILKRIRTLLGAPATLGQQAMVDSSPVVIASDQSDVPITLDGEDVVEAPCPVAHCVTNTPAVNVAAVATAAGVGAISHVLYGVEWSYSDTPVAAATLIITDGGAVIKTIYPTHEGPGFLPFGPGIEMVANQDLVATLQAGGAGVFGSVNMTIKQV